MAISENDSQPLDLAAENATLRGELQQFKTFIDAIEKVAKACDAPGSEVETVDLLNDVLESAMRALDAKDASLLAVDEDNGELVFVLARGEIPQDAIAWKRIPSGEGVAGWVVDNRLATIVNDAQVDDRFYGHVDREYQFRTRSILAAPLLGGGQVLGVVELLNKRSGRLFTQNDLNLLSLFCRFAGELLYTLVHGPAGRSIPMRSTD